MRRAAFAFLLLAAAAHSAPPPPVTRWASYVLIAPGTLLGISTFGEDEAGELYVASYATGRIYAIEGPPDAVNPSLRCDVSAGCLPRRVAR